MSVFSEILSL